MKIAVLGTGMVGQAVAAKLSDLGHETTVGTRDPQATLARTEPDGMGNPPFSAWHAEHPAVPRDVRRGRRAGRPRRQRDQRRRLLEVLAQAGAANLAGKVLLDIANPLDSPRASTLFVKDTDSARRSSAPSRT